MTLQTARVGKNNRAQVVTIPLEYRFPEGMKDVFIRKIGEDSILSPRPTDWRLFLASSVRVSDDFMVGIDDLPIQERAGLSLCLCWTRTSAPSSFANPRKPCLGRFRLCRYSNNVCR